MGVNGVSYVHATVQALFIHIIEHGCIFLFEDKSSEFDQWRWGVWRLLFVLLFIYIIIIILRVSFFFYWRASCVKIHGHATDCKIHQMRI